MMHSLRSYLSSALTAGVAAASAGLIALAPVAAPLAGPATQPVAVALAAGDAPWLSIPLATVDVSQLVGLLGIGSATVSGILDQTGLADQSVADVAIGLLDAAGYDSNATVLQVLDLPPTLTVGDALTQLVDAVFGDDVTVTGMIRQLTGGTMTVGDLLTTGLDSLGIGQKTVVDLVGGTPAATMTIEQLIVNLLQQNGDPTPAQLLAADPTVANATLGEILESLPPTSNTTPGMYDSLSDQPIQLLLSSPEAGGLGDETIRTIAGIPGGIAGAAACAAVLGMGLNCSDTLNSYLGTNSVGQTLDNITSKTDSVWDPSVHAGTPLSHITMANLLNSTGPFASMPLSQFVTGLNLTTPTLATLLTELGFADKTIDALLADSFPSLFATPLLRVLDAWGLGTLQVDTVIDRLGLDTPVVTVLSRLGLDDVHVDTVIDDLLGGNTIGEIVNDLGFGGTDINTIIDSMGLADNDLFTVFLQVTGLVPSIVVGLPD